MTFKRPQRLPRQRPRKPSKQREPLLFALEVTNTKVVVAKMEVVEVKNGALEELTGAVGLEKKAKKVRGSIGKEDMAKMADELETR